MGESEYFISKARSFRLHFGLSEQDIDSLLNDEGVLYSKLESGKRTLTLQLAEAYPRIYGMGYCEFKKDETTPPQYEDLPFATRNYIDNKPKTSVGLKGSKNIASHIIHEIKSYSVGRKFLNFEILKKLPPPLNKETTIDWTNGLLEGLAKSTKKYENYKDEDGKLKRGMVYILVKKVTAELLEKAMKNIEEENR